MDLKLRENGLICCLVEKDRGSVSRGSSITIPNLRFWVTFFFLIKKDESTSAVSIDFEGVLYYYAKERGITFFTVSQRNSLYEYHDYLLKFDGDKHWTFEQIIHK